MQLELHPSTAESGCLSSSSQSNLHGSPTFARNRELGKWSLRKLVRAQDAPPPELPSMCQEKSPPSSRLMFWRFGNCRHCRRPRRPGNVSSQDKETASCPIHNTYRAAFEFPPDPWGCAQPCQKLRIKASTTRQASEILRALTAKSRHGQFQYFIRRYNGLQTEQACLRSISHQSNY
jgi:hypothetical protein